jgi:hypothetical protein
VSRDIFVQDLPPGIESVDDIPDEFVPRPLTVTRAQVIAALSAEAPHANTSDPAWVIVAVPGRYHIEANLGTSEHLDHFAFHVRGGADAEQLIARVLDRLALRALDVASESGLFIGGVPAG